MIGTRHQSCWLAEVVRVLLLLQRSTAVRGAATDYSTFHTAKIKSSMVHDNAQSVMQGGAKSDPARDLADASADLMQSLDNLLESLENPQADKAKPDASYSDSILAHQAQAQHAEFESEAASGTSSATLVHDGRTEPDSVGLQQHPPRFQGFVGEPH